MPFDLLSLPQDVRNHILVYVAQSYPIANLARASRVNRELNKQWKENPLLLKALLKTTQSLANHCPGPAPLETVVHEQRTTTFNIAGLPQDLRNHILACCLSRTSRARSASTSSGTITRCFSRRC